LLGEEILPVLVLTFKLLVGALDGGFLLLQLADLLLKDFHLLALLHSAPDCAFSILEALSCLLVSVGVLGIVVGAAPVHNRLLEVLLFLLGQANCTAHGALKGLGHLVFIG